jgi:hypothetical protein
MNDCSPIISEFETPERAAACERWLDGKVAVSLADTRPGVSHNEAMARARAIIRKQNRKRALGSTTHAKGGAGLAAD